MVHLSRPTASGNGHTPSPPPNGGMASLTQDERRRLWATRRVRTAALGERVDEIAAMISAAVLAAIEPRLAALENGVGTSTAINGSGAVGNAMVGEVHVVDADWDRGPTVDPALLAKRDRQTSLVETLAYRRVWGRVPGALRQARELLAANDELARVNQQILLMARS